MSDRMKDGRPSLSDSARALGPVVKILDCTLRDGGYINNFRFGKRSIKAILEKLGKARIDIVECGFISENAADEDSSVFGSVEAIGEAIGEKRPGTMYVGMIALGEKEIAHEKLSPNDGGTIDGIRITFHEHEIERAFEFARAVRAKGYEPFMQPIGTTSYTDAALLSLIEKTNELKPFAFYIVDTLGAMYSRDLLRMFHLVDHNLAPETAIGFHSHNNLQLSFANAQTLMLLHTKRTMFIDSSVFGMGRGAGNLCTELISQYINENVAETYDVIPLLEIVDEHLASIFAETPWGYSVPFYLAAVNNCHPNYASHLLNKGTITVPTIKTLLQRIPERKRTLFNKEIIENIYLDFQSNHYLDRSVLSELKESLAGRSVLLIAPGKTIETEKERIGEFIRNENPAVIAVNFRPERFRTDYSFVSNVRRLERLKELSGGEADFDPGHIFTSNLRDHLPAGSKGKIVDYGSLLSDVEDVHDNAGLMAIQLMSKVGCSFVYLAGFDGFSRIADDNFIEGDMNSDLSKDRIHTLNTNLERALKELNARIKIHFITTSHYDVSGETLQKRDAA